MEDVKLYNGDCVEVMNMLIADGVKVDCIITDPPYEIETKGAGIYKQEDKQYVKELESMSNGFSEVILDRMCMLQDKINMYFFCSQKQIIPLLDYFVKKKKCNYNLLTWHKTNPVPACGNKYLTDTEFVLFFREKGVRIMGNFNSKFTYYISPLNQKDKKLYGHPTVKPLELVKRYVLNSTNDGDTIFDPFMGSGTTGVACKNLNRKFIGIEIDKKYFDIAVDRLSK